MDTLRGVKSGAPLSGLPPSLLSCSSRATRGPSAQSRDPVSRLPSFPLNAIQSSLLLLGQGRELWSRPHGEPRKGSLLESGALRGLSAGPPRLHWPLEGRASRAQVPGRVFRCLSLCHTLPRQKQRKPHLSAALPSGFPVQAQPCGPLPPPSPSQTSLKAQTPQSHCIYFPLTLPVSCLLSPVCCLLSVLTSVCLRGTVRGKRLEPHPAGST